VVLSAQPETRWIPDYFESLGAEQATNLQITDAASADSADVAAAIEAADGVFIKGGDQWEYVRSWRGTRTEDAIRTVFQRGGVVGGTSAGAHILSEVVFDARRGTVYPEEAIRDPFNQYMSLSNDFLGFVPASLIDSHFTRRGRLGRLVPLLARWRADTGEDVLGIGVDEKTALLVDPQLHGEVVGEGTVSFLRATPTTRFDVRAGRPPVMTHVAYDQLTEGFVFDLVDRRVVVVAESASIDLDLVGYLRPQATELLGGDDDSAAAGLARVVVPGGDSYALQLGMLNEADGLGRIGRMVVMPRAFADPDQYENRVGGLQWLLSRHPGATGVLMDTGARAEVSGSGWLLTAREFDEPAVLVLDARRLEAVDASIWWSFPDSVGPRQSVALVGLEVHVIASGMAYSDILGQVVGVGVRKPTGRRLF
jgi:cyanophycinase